MDGTSPGSLRRIVSVSPDFQRNVVSEDDDIQGGHSADFAPQSHSSNSQRRQPIASSPTQHNELLFPSPDETPLPS